MRRRAKFRGGPAALASTTGQWNWPMAIGDYSVAVVSSGRTRSIWRRELTASLAKTFVQVILHGPCADEQDLPGR
jgi:hypothetical protein